MKLNAFLLLLVFTVGCRTELPTEETLLACPKIVSLQQARNEMKRVPEDVIIYGYHPNDSTTIYYQYDEYYNSENFLGINKSSLVGMAIEQKCDLFDSTRLYDFAAFHHCTISHLDTMGASNPMRRRYSAYISF